MRKSFIPLLLFISLGIAEKALAQAKKTIITVPANTTKLNTKSNDVLSTSDFIGIKKGDEIELQADLTKPPRSHQFLKGFLKSTSAFALTYP